MNFVKEQILSKARGLVAMRDLLHEPRWWATRELAERLGVSPRTVQRWLVDMDAIGCAVEERGETWCRRYRGMDRRGSCAVERGD